MAWKIFERDAHAYEQWYESRAGLRADRAEKALLAWLLDDFPVAQSVLEIGCGSGHFTGWLGERGLRTVGLDRAPTMLAEARRRLPECPLVLADAHRLPLRDRSVDLTLFVTTLEFLDTPECAAIEAARVSRCGVIVIALNRWSLGALSRRRGRDSRRAHVPLARDYSQLELRALLEAAGGSRIQRLRCRSSLFPAAFSSSLSRLPLGNVIGLAARLKE